MTTTLANRALLVSLTVSQWTARKLDKKETSAIALKHGIQNDIARVHKSLLPMADSLDAIHQKTGEIRTFYYKNTLPWAQEGIGIIRAEGYMDFVSAAREHMEEWRRRVDVFVAAYPQLREDARVFLNGLYREEDYPETWAMREKFAIDVKFMPVPSASTWLVDVIDEDMDELKADLRKDLAKAEMASMSEAWKRVHEVVAKGIERLGKPDNIFRDSLVENARELCKVLPMLNISNDPDLEKIRADLEGSLCQHTPEQLRSAPEIRSAVADRLREIESAMGAFYKAA